MENSKLIRKYMEKCKIMAQNNQNVDVFENQIDSFNSL